jgi:hypothetical protein
VNEANIHTRVVRAFGSEVTHVVDAPTGQFADMFFVTSFVGIDTPVVTRCGAVLRSAHRAAVCMMAGTRVKCSRCKRITGLTVAPAGNELLPTAESWDVHP